MTTPRKGKAKTLTPKWSEAQSARFRKHGGEGAIKRIADGKPLVGLAREAELSVYSDLEGGGRYALVVRNATRLQAACDLFWNAVQTATENKDLQALDRYIARFGWLASVSLRAWAQVKTETGDADDGLILDAIESAKGEKDGAKSGDARPTD